jgi:MoaA/NifB/PqqE/SkfB family radical SAM enzyme
MSSEKILETVKNLSDAGVCFLNIEGGDAFLRFNDLCKIMDALDDSMEVWVNTGGTNITLEKLQILKKQGVRGIMVSIHGSDAAFHDDFVGVQGAFELAKQSVLLANEAGLGTAINTVLTHEQIERNVLSDVMLLARSCSCDFVQLIHPKRAGKWLENESLNQKDDAIKKFVSKAHRYYNSRNDFPALAAQAEEEHPNKFGCTCGGTDRFYVGAGGEIQPCEFLNVSFGNVNEESFDVIFKRMREAFKVPCCEWMCEVKAGEIYDFMQKHSLTKTPIPFEYTKELVKNWNNGTPTKLYTKLGIYDG